MAGKEGAPAKRNNSCQAVNLGTELNRLAGLLLLSLITKDRERERERERDDFSLQPP